MKSGVKADSDTEMVLFVKILTQIQQTFKKTILFKVWSLQTFNLKHIFFVNQISNGQNNYIIYIHTHVNDINIMTYAWEGKLHCMISVTLSAR